MRNSKSDYFDQVGLSASHSLGDPCRSLSGYVHHLRHPRVQYAPRLPPARRHEVVAQSLARLSTVRGRSARRRTRRVEPARLRPLALGAKQARSVAPRAWRTRLRCRPCGNQGFRRILLANPVNGLRFAKDMTGTYLSTSPWIYAPCQHLRQTLDAQLDQPRAEGCTRPRRETASGARPDRYEPTEDAERPRRRRHRDGDPVQRR
jgi:hypothetical protein